MPVEMKLSRTALGLGLQLSLWLGLLLVAMLAATCAAEKLPSNLKTCYRTDDHLSECLRDAISDALPKVKHGLPKFNIPNLDPIILQRMDISKGHGSVALRLSFKNMTVHNFFDNLKVLKSSVDLAKYTIDLSLSMARLVSKGLYEVKGRVMVFPVNGHGAFSTVMHEPSVSIKIVGKPVVHKDGLTYLSIDDVVINQKPKKLVMHFENIINGDKALSENFNKFINENWKLVFDEISPNLFKSLGDVIKIYFRDFFNLVPFSEIFPYPPSRMDAPAVSSTQPTNITVSV